MTSNEIKSFLDFVQRSTQEYKTACETVEKENRRLQDFLHAIEFEEHAKERSKICTKFRESRKQRRISKDTMEELEPLVKFFQEPNHKRTLDKMTQLLGEVRKVEKYHANRHYCPRVDDKEQKERSQHHESNKRKT